MKSGKEGPALLYLFLLSARIYDVYCSYIFEKGFELTLDLRYKIFVELRPAD